MVKFLQKQKEQEKVVLSRINEKKKYLGRNIFLLVVLFVVSFSYFWQVNNMASQAFLIEGYEKQIKELEKTNNDLDTDIISWQSLNSVQTRMKNLNLVPVENIEYLTENSSAVAQR